MRWQQPARFGVAMFFVAFAAVVYFSLGERQEAAPAPPVERQDPTATLEAESGRLTAISGVDEDYEVSAKSILNYGDGSSKRSGVRITVTKRNGRDFVISAAEASSGPDEKELELEGTVRLEASDGFWLETEAATYNRDDGLARAPGAVSFGRGRMTGTGVGMSYDQRNDVLTITEQSAVTLAGTDQEEPMAFQAGAATLNRLQDLLQMEGGVHVVRGEEQFDADRAVARMSAMEEFVTFIELRGNARVAGTTGLDAMSARDIDLDYTDDGVTLERIVLTGDAAVALAAPAGSTGTGREIFGGALDLALAPDGTVVKAIGRDGVRATFPAGTGAPAREIRSRQLDGDGVPGQGLTAVRFTEAVEYREGTAAAPGREARSQSLGVVLDGDAVSDATFAGRVTFRDQGLEARAASAEYSPTKGTIHLSGSDAGGGPAVSDERIQIEAATIDVEFESRHMTAKGDSRGDLRTTLKPQPPAAGRGGRGGSASKLPGLLKAGEAVTINAPSLDYGGTGGRVLYTGGTVLRQGTDTYIRASRIEIDQEEGNLTATGGARSSFTDESGTTEGTADDIRYTDARRLLTFATTAALPARARFKGPHGDLQARTIDIALAPGGTRPASLDAETLVSIEIDRRTITGAHLHYDAATEVYAVQGATGRPMTFVDRTTPGACQQSTGMKLTFDKRTNNIKVDGQERLRPSTGGGGACAAAPASRPATPPPAAASPSSRPPAPTR